MTAATASFIPPSGRLKIALRRIGTAIAWCGYLFLLFPSLIVIPVSFGGAQEFEFPPRSFSLRLYAQFFGDPRREQDQIVFIDARDDQHYQAGHIPGAYQFDHYHAENYLATVMPLCQGAQQIVVYCNGGECEDSEFAATMLKDLGIGKEKIFVYGGGITEWNRSGRKIETGARNSRNLIDPPHNP